MSLLILFVRFFEHNSTRITRGGDNGRPINFWNDSLTQEHFEIKSTLDKGDVEIFGMTMVMIQLIESRVTVSG